MCSVQRASSSHDFYRWVKACVFSCILVCVCVCVCAEVCVYMREKQVKVNEKSTKPETHVEGHILHVQSHTHIHTVYTWGKKKCQNHFPLPSFCLFLFIFLPFLLFCWPDWPILCQGDWLSPLPKCDMYVCACVCVWKAIFAPVD